MITLQHAFVLGRYDYTAAAEWSRIRAAESELRLPMSDPVVVKFEMQRKTGGFEVVVGLTSPYFASYGYLDFFALESDAKAFIAECEVFVQETKR